mgnify:CR=1 FL=1
MGCGRGIGSGTGTGSPGIGSGTGIANKYGADTILSGAELIYMLLVPSAFEFDKEENEGSRETT